MINRSLSLSVPFYRSFKIEILLLLTAMFWGTSYGLTKSALVYVPVLLFIPIRFSLTFFSLLPLVIMDFRKGKSRDWWISVPTGLILSAIFFCEVYGVQHTSASNAAFLISLCVIMTGFAEWFINKQPIEARQWILAVLSLVGVYLLTDNKQLSWSLNTGDYSILCAALLRAIMVTSTKRLIADKAVSTVTLTCFQSLTVTLCSLLFAYHSLAKEFWILPSAPRFWFIILYLVICCTLFAFYVQNQAVRKISPTKAALLMGSEPMFGLLFAVLWLHESVSVTQLSGGVFILISVLVSSRQKKQPG